MIAGMKVSATSCSVSMGNAIARDGAVVLPRLVDELRVEALIAAVSQMNSPMTSDAVRRRRGSVFAVRNLAALCPAVKRLAESEDVRAVIGGLLESDSPVLVRSILFDKPAMSNWLVTWHQDTTIAVRQRIETPGFGPWSVKAGIVHVRPPAAVLESMLTLRLHLDDTDETNGALRVLPGSHRMGILEADAIAEAVERGSPRLGTAHRGDALLMKPLILHASGRSESAHRSRRVIHLEYAAATLPNGLTWCDNG